MKLQIETDLMAFNEEVPFCHCNKTSLNYIDKFEVKAIFTVYDLNCKLIRSTFVCFLTRKNNN